MNKTSRALRLSLLVIVAYWAASSLLADSSRPLTPGFLVAYVCLKTAVLLAVILPLLRATGESLSDLGFGVAQLRASLSRAPLHAALIFLAVNVLAASLLSAVGIPGSTLPPEISSSFQNIGNLPLWIFLAVVGGGFNEEMLRAFVLTRFQRAFGLRGVLLAIAADTAHFALGHSYQGAGGIIGAGLSGLLFALVFLRRRSAADSILAHAGYDLIGVAAAFALASSR